ncbi:MAG: hypothetical protein ABFC24_12355 [Methanoregulaceae archaeon]
MNRGRRPSVALYAAALHGSQDGSRILQVGVGSKTGVNLVAVGTGSVRLVRIRSPRNIIPDPEQVAITYHREIAFLRDIPAPGCVEKVLALFESDGTLRSFRILPGSIEAEE